MLTTASFFLLAICAGASAAWFVSGILASRHVDAAIRLKEWNISTGEAFWPQTAQAHLEARDRWSRLRLAAIWLSLLSGLFAMAVSFLGSQFVAR